MQNPSIQVQLLPMLGMSRHDMSSGAADFLSCRDISRHFVTCRQMSRQIRPSCREKLATFTCCGDMSPTCRRHSQHRLLPFYRNHCTHPMGNVSDKTSGI